MTILANSKITVKNVYLRYNMGMNASQRRERIVNALDGSDRPISAAALAKQYHVSRQIIVGDVALLRASGHNILATPRGYILEHPDQQNVYRIACRHNAEQMQEELYAIVDEGCTVIDVIVSHPIYGQLTGQLNLSNRHDVDEFVRKSRASNSTPISALTDGIHLHTLRSPDPGAVQRVRTKLKEMGILYTNET
jgi:transcriptional regulator of NAD metabolism